MVKCIELIHQNGGADMQIYKTMDFYNCNVTETVKLCQMKNYGVSDELLKFKINWIMKFMRSLCGIEIRFMI